MSALYAAAIRPAPDAKSQSFSPPVAVRDGSIDRKYKALGDRCAASQDVPRYGIQAWLAGSLPSAAWAAARRAIGTRNGEHET